MTSGLRDRVLLRAAPSRLLFFPLYLIMFLLAALSLGISLELLPLGLPEVAGYNLDAVLALAAATLSFVTFLTAELKRITRRYLVLEHSVARREGILSKRIQYMPYGKVERVEVNQSVLKRLFGIGDLLIDTGEDIIVFQAIRNPAKVNRVVAERLTARYASQPSA
ncbi:MAG: PH domain-containing protein [Thermoplasmata archaeon]